MFASQGDAFRTSKFDIVRSFVMNLTAILWFFPVKTFKHLCISMALDYIFYSSVSVSS